MAAKKKIKKKPVIDNRKAHRLGDRIGATGRHFGGVGGVYLIVLKCVARDNTTCTFKDKDGNTFVALIGNIAGVVGTHNNIAVQVCGHDIFAGVRRTFVQCLECY